MCGKICRQGCPAVSAPTFNLKTCCYRLNNFMNRLDLTIYESFSLCNGVFFVKYPEITWHAQEMFCGNGVHLSNIGNSYCVLLFN